LTLRHLLRDKKKYESIGYWLPWRFSLACCYVAMAGCRRAPESYPMPPQRVDPSYFLIKFSDLDADEYLVRDIYPGDARRWTADHPEMCFPIEPRPNLRFELSFLISSATLVDTGPVTLAVKINGHPLGSVYCPHAGNYRFDRPVPLHWLRPGEPVRVLAEVNRLWTSPTDGAHLGYLIEEAGFRW